MTRPPRPDRSLRPALKALAACDADIARHLDACGLPPVRWRQPGFAGLLHIIVAQQVSAHAAGAVIGRLDARARPLTPEAFLALDDADLRTIGLSRQKIRYGRALARDVRTGRMDLDGLPGLDDEAVVAYLTKARGIGRWTAEIYLLFALRRPDIWPAGDLAVQVSAQALKGLPERPTRARLVELAEPWRPHRSAAARFLWHIHRHPGLPGGRRNGEAIA